MAYKPEVKQLNAPVILNSDVESNWNAMTVALPAGFMAYASDTGVLKVGDGTTLYANLPVFYNQGMVSAVQHIHYVADITARDALTGSAKEGLVIVLDASGDATVTSTTKKQATYVWNATGGTGGTGAWIKLAEEESMDVDLSDYFAMSTHTADNITDGTNKVLMTPAERTSLAGLVTNAFMKNTDTADDITEGTTHLFMTPTERTNLSEVHTNAVRYTDSIVVTGANASQVAALIATGA